MHVNNRGQSDVVTHQTNIWNKVYSNQRGFIPSKGFFTTILCSIWRDGKWCNNLERHNWQC